MTRKMKAILVLFFAAEIVNSAKVGVLKGRIADLETQRDIYASRAKNWLDRAVEDEEVIDSLQIRLDETADRKIELTEAGTFSARHIAQNSTNISAEKDTELRPAASLYRQASLWQRTRPSFRMERFCTLRA